MRPILPLTGSSLRQFSEDDILRALETCQGSLRVRYDIRRRDLLKRE